jgi:hypothetical protein
VHPVDKSGEQCGHKEREQRPIFDDDKGRQGKEIKADILLVHWIVGAVGHLIKVPQKGAPVAGFPPSDKKSD